MLRNPCRRPSGALAVLGRLLSAALLPAEEPVDWDMVNRIRDEGFHRSEVMEVLEHLSDRIGPRLTGSPGMKEANEWTRAKLEEWGLEEAHLEPFEFGRGWSFSHTSVHLQEPREMPLFALPKAWTPGTDGPVRGPAVRFKVDSPKDFDKYRGKLRGKVLLLDEARELRAADEDPPILRFDADELAALEEFPIPDGEEGNWRAKFRKRIELYEKLNELLVEEGALATVDVSSRAGLVRVTGGGSYEVGKSPGVPALVMTAEHYNLLVRLLDAAAEEAGEAQEAEDEGDPDEEKPKEGPSGPGWDSPSPVVLEIDVRARFHDDDLMAYNTLAEIPGSGEGLVMVGGHLDSWHGATGTTDNGAGCAVAMEAMLFDRVGLPGFQFIQDDLDYGSRTHHTNVDPLDHASREDLVQASVVVASFLYHAAMRDEPLPRKPMPRYEPRE